MRECETCVACSDPTARVAMRDLTPVSLMAKAGALPAEIARHLGHVDGGILVSRRYQHLFPDAFEGAQHRLDRLIAEADAGSVRDQVVSKV